MVKLPTEFNVDFNYPGIDVKVELSILKDYLAHLESGVHEIGEQYILNERGKYLGCEYHEYSHVYDIAEEEFPRLIKLPFLVTIHTAFESSVVRLLNYAKTREGAGLSLRDLDSRKTKVKKFNKYLRHILNYDFHFNTQFEQEFSDLSKVRNCVAHANGVFEALSKEHQDGIERLIDRNIGVSITSGGIDVSYDLLKKSMESVSVAVEKLMKFMESRYGFYQ
ncbi:hypothetical protein [Microbulbifer litoralis]|uniref:hypothetical protein n=1 Tax=Microbulbifer litoralis TaxID=2933965 RepID=UPI00202811FF|nr:hypothetical protein [Microbulbifer sp. GX H0434]